jgi:hypothetical protein
MGTERGVLELTKGIRILLRRKFVMSFEEPREYFLQDSIPECLIG